MREYSLPKQNKITKRQEYLALSKSGKKIQNKYFIAIYRQNNLPHSRIGITVTKKVGGAVRRNKLKRLVKEAFRLNRNQLTEHIDINIIVKNRVTELPFEIVSSSLKTIFNKACE